MTVDALNRKYPANEMVIGMVENKKNALLKSIKTLPFDGNGQMPIDS